MKFRILFILILILAAVLRLWALDQYPAGFNGDEASIGYNAYSIWQTGKDEYGSFWPLTFKSFGDYKPGLYFYFVIPFVATLGLDEWAIRLPSALLGIGTVILIYFLAKEVFKNRWVGILSSLLLAISPWHLHFSRGGWETNAATFFITLGILLFLKGLSNFYLLWWSLFSFLVSMYIYQSPRLIVPVFLVILFTLYRQDFTLILSKLRVRKILISTGVLLFFAMPLAFQFLSGTGSARFEGLSFLADAGPVSRVDELRGEHGDLHSLSNQILHNKLTAYVPSFLGHYLDHFKPDFLFINGDPIIRNKVPETGQFFVIESLFLILGLVALVKFKINHAKLLIFWILIAPLASSVTFQTPHALRALNLVIPLTLVMGYGLWMVIKKLREFKRFFNITIIIFIIIIIVFEFTHYLESYYIHYPERYPQAFEYGFKQMVSKLVQYEPHYNNIIITDRYDQPYILLLFYKKYDPKKYQPQAKLSPRDKFNFGTVRSFDKYQFRKIDPEEIKNQKDTLFIGTEDEIPKDVKIMDRVDFPNGQPAFLILGT